MIRKMENPAALTSRSSQNNHMQRALFQQVSPCKPCADPHMNLPEKGDAHTEKMQAPGGLAPRAADVFVLPPPVFSTPPSSWSLDGETREQVPYVPPSSGGVMMPPVPPRSFPPGTIEWNIYTTAGVGSEPALLLPCRPGLLQTCCLFHRTLSDAL